MDLDSLSNTNQSPFKLQYDRFICAKNKIQAKTKRFPDHSKYFLPSRLETTKEINENSKLTHCDNPLVDSPVAVQENPSLSFKNGFSNNRDFRNFVLDYENPEKIFPYAGILDLSSVKIPSVIHTISLLPKDSRLTDFCPQYDNSINSKVILNSEKIGNVPKLNYCSYRSAHVHPRYFGPNRIRREDNHFFRGLSSGFYFSATDSNLTSEPLFVFLILTILSLGFFSAVYSSFYPLVTLIKPPRINCNRFRSFPKSPSYHTCQNFPESFTKRVISGLFAPFNPQITKKNPSKGSFFSTCEASRDNPQEDIQSDTEIRKISTYILISEVSKHLPLLCSSKTSGPNKTSKGCTSCMENIKTFDLTSQKKHYLNNIVNLGLYFDQGTSHPLENVSSVASQKSSPSNLQWNEGSVRLEQHKEFEIPTLSKQNHPQQRAGISPNFQKKNAISFIPKIHSFNLRALFPFKRNIQNSPEERKYSKSVNDLCNQTNGYSKGEEVAVYYRTPSVLDKLRELLEDSCFEEEGFRIKKSFFKEKTESCGFLTETLGTESPQKSLFRKRKRPLENNESDQSFQFPNNSSREVDHNISDHHYSERFRYSRTRKYYKRLKNLQNHQFQKEDEFTGFVPRRKGSSNSRSQENSFFIRLTSSNASERKNGFKSSQNSLENQVEQDFEVVSKRDFSILKNSFIDTSFASFNGFSYKSSHSQDIEQFQARKFSTLISRFPLNSSELFSASSVLEFSNFETLMPLNSSSLHDPVYALNIETSSDYSSDCKDITDMRPKSSELRINYLTQESEDWHIIELSAGNIKQPSFLGLEFQFCPERYSEDLDSKTCRFTTPPPDSKSSGSLPKFENITSGSLRRNVEGVPISTEESFYDVSSHNSEIFPHEFLERPPEKIPFETSSKLDTKTSPSSSPLPEERQLSPVPELKSGNSQVNERELKQQNLFTGHSATTLSPYVLVDSINTAGEFSSDSEESTVRDGTDIINEFPKSILLTSNTKKTESTYPNKVRFSLKSKVTEECPVIPDTLSTKMLAFDKKLIFKMRSFAEEESRRQNNVRQKISEALVKGIISNPSQETSDRHRSSDLSKNVSQGESTKVENINGFQNIGENIQKDQLQILTMGQDGELKPHFFQYIHGVLESVSFGISESWEYI